MPSLMSNHGPDFSLADRAAAARRRYFVGRTAELELFQAALTAAEPPFAVLHLYGPGGIGKTTLLAEYGRIAHEAGLSPLYLDGRLITPAPADFFQALNQALGQKPDQNPLPLLNQQARPLLFIDTYEKMTPLDGWLQETFLPQLPGHSLVVIAGRNPPSSGWRTRPGWRDLVRIISLRNLPPQESRAYLSARQIPAERQTAVLEFTHGHPLALSLVADLLDQNQAAIDPQTERDVVGVLLEKFLETVPSAQHRHALEICAHARVTTESLLANLLGEAEAPTLFAWLSTLSFIEQGREGLFPHDLAREVLDADFRWRNPQAYRTLHLQIQNYFWQRQLQSDWQAHLEALYLQRHHPLMKAFFDWHTYGQMYVEPAAPPDYPLILAMVRQHEGEASARIAAYWLDRQPSAFLAFRRAPGTLSGFVAHLQLAELTAADRAADPAIPAVHRYTGAHGPLRPGDVVQITRFWMGGDAYQSPDMQTLVALTATVIWHGQPRPAWTVGFVADPDFWQPMFTFYNLWRAPEADFALGERQFAAFAHDWRVEPVEVWAQLIHHRILDSEPKPETLAPPPPLLALSQPEFAGAVRQALRDYTRPDLLAANPLLRSRLVTQNTAGQATTADLQSVLRETAKSLQANPKDLKLYRALWHTYFNPAPTQETAAERLDLPFSTYRYHLGKAIERLTHQLWQRELYGHPQ
jgi:hypothetical protein